MYVCGERGLDEERGGDTPDLYVEDGKSACAFVVGVDKQELDAHED